MILLKECFEAFYASSELLRYILRYAWVLQLRYSLFPLSSTSRIPSFSYDRESLRK